MNEETITAKNLEKVEAVNGRTMKEVCKGIGNDHLKPIFNRFPNEKVLELQENKREIVMKIATAETGDEDVKSTVSCKAFFSMTIQQLVMTACGVMKEDSSPKVYLRVALEETAITDEADILEIAPFF